jgi:hypothetical protein
MGQVTLAERTKGKFTLPSSPTEREAFSLDKFEKELKLIPKDDLPFYRPDRRVKSHLKKLLLIEKTVEKKEPARRESDRKRSHKQKKEIAAKASGSTKEKEEE